MPAHLAPPAGQSWDFAHGTWGLLLVTHPPQPLGLCHISARDLAPPAGHPPPCPWDFVIFPHGTWGPAGHPPPAPGTLSYFRTGPGACCWSPPPPPQPLRCTCSRVCVCVNFLWGNSALYFRTARGLFAWHYTLTYAVSGDPRSPGLPRIGAHPPWLVAGGLPEHGDVRHLTVGATVPAQYATQSPLALSLFKTSLERNALFARYPYLPRLSRPPISGTAPYRCPPSMASCRGSP